MKISRLALVEILALIVFWTLEIAGYIEPFNTLIFFESITSLFFIAMIILAGMLIGGLYERQIMVKEQERITRTGKRPIDLLKTHITWLSEISPNQLFDAPAIGEMINEAEQRASGSTEGVEQESETKSPDGRYHLCRSDASKHTCINPDKERK